MADSLPVSQSNVGIPSHPLPHSDFVRCETNEPLYFEDLDEGDTWRSPLREITAENVETFSELTGDFDPLHQSGGASSRAADGSTNEDEPASNRPRSPFGRPVVQGLLGLGVLAGLGTEYPRAATLALVGLSDWKFCSPIYFGDMVRAETTVERCEPHGRRAGRITWFRKLVSEDGRTLQEGRFVSLVAARNVNPRRPR